MGRTELLRATARWRAAGRSGPGVVHQQDLDQRGQAVGARVPVRKRMARADSPS